MTVEWEGIQTGDHPDTDVKGFLVEYRAEKDKHWMVHSGIIPYKGPNHQYRVQIPKLPTGVAYFVRIKVLGAHNEILVETAEIRARNEIVSIKCENDDLTAPRHLEVTHEGQYSLAIKWDAPECGSIGEYQVELIGEESPFDVHRQTVTQPQVSVTNLLPATNYNVKIRAVDRQRKIGPWNSDIMQAKTQGERVAVSNDIHLVFRTDSELHFSWKPIEDDRAQHYEVMAVELLPESRRVERARVPPYISCHTLSDLLPGTKYIIGVIAFVDHEPKLVYHLEAETAEGVMESWREKPQVVDEGEGEFSVRWNQPKTTKPVSKFIVQYRLPNETFWRSLSEPEEVEDGAKSYDVALPVMEGTSVFTVRLMALDDQSQVVARSEEVTMGEAAANACVGTAGIPEEVTVALAQPTVLRFSWAKPNCDESVAPIDGYEYLIHETAQQMPHSGASYIGGTAVAIPDLRPSTGYSFRVRSRNANGHSPWSEVLLVSTPAEGSLGGSFLQLTYSRSRLKLTALTFTCLCAARSLGTTTNCTVQLSRVAYKQRDSAHWTRVYGCPEDFRCPTGLADPADFCLQLRNLLFSVHYISRVSYNLTNGEVFDSKSTIHFSLLNLLGTLTLRSRPFTLLYNWSPGVEQTSRLQVTITQPRIEQQGPRNIVYWSTSGDTSQLLGYQVDIRKDGDREWTELGPVVRSEPSQSHFRQSLGSVPVATYYLRVRAIDTSGATLTTSPSTSFSVACQVPISPENVRLDRVSEDRVRISWSFPTEDLACQTFFFINGVQNGQPVSHRVPGTERSFDINVPARGDWRVEVRAVNSAGSGPASQQAIFTSAQQSLVSAPRVTARGNDLHVDWRSEGDGRGVFGYRLQFRTESSGWNPYGQIVPYVGDNQDYSQTLTGLQKGHTYAIHIQVLDRNSYVMYVSPEASAVSSCTAPSHAPSHLQVQAPDASHVRVHWALPPQSTWGCADIQYEIQVVEPKSIPPVTVAGGQTNHIFQSHPNQQWSVRIRAKNSAGQSAWTPTAEVRTPPGGELVVGPNIAYRQGNPIITWQSRENVDDLIDSFVLEWKTATEQDWRQHRNPIPFSGWQRPYTIDLGELPKGHTYQVRVVVKDKNRNTAFTSPIVQVQTQSACQPPRRAPTNLQVSPIGPTQIRLTWAPLHESEWNCDRMWYIVKYSTPKNQGFKNLTQGENSVVFESDPYTKWNFEVQAANPAGETQWSRTETAQTQDASPGPVADLRVQPVGPDRLQVSWRPPLNPNGLITQYEITYQLISKGMCDQQQDVPRTISVTSPNHVITGLHPHSRYRVGVAAKTTIAGERVSQEVQTEQSVPSAAPVYLRVEDVKEMDASVSWQAPPCLQTNGEITEYEYEVTPADRRAAPQRIANNVRGTRTQITGLQPFTRYNIKVRAYTSRGPGPWSSDVGFQTTATQTVSPPPFVRVINTGADNAHLVWQSPHPPSGYIDKYKCRYSAAGTQNYQERQFPAVSPCQARILEKQQLPTPPPGSRMHCGRIDNLKPEQTYDFQVAAHVPERGWSPWSPPERTKVTDEAVQILTIDKTGGTESSLTVSWTVRPQDRNRVTSFRLHIEPLDGTSRPQTFNVDRSTYQYRIDSLRPRTQYNVTVQAATDKELCGGTTTTMWTDAAPLTALAVAPRVIAEEATSVTIEWDSRNREAGGFIVEFRLEGGAWQQHPRRIPAHPSQTTYTAAVDDLPTNNVVDLRVRVVSQQNEQSNPSPEVRARTKCSPPPDPPQASPLHSGIRVDAPSTNDVRVSWARPAKNTWMCDQMNVEISYRVGNEPEKILPVPGDQTEYTFPSEPNQRWVIKLRATNQVGSSRWSAEQTATTRQGAPGAVRDLRVKALSPNEVHVQWLAPLVQRGTIVGYDISYRLKHRLACPEEEPRDVSRDFVTVYNHKDLDYTITGLLPYSLYEVRVRARTTELGPEETKEVSTEQQPPSSPPLNLELTYALERSLSFQWEPVDCSQRHGHIVNYEYEILGQDDWAKLERQIANTSETKITIDGLTPFTKYVMRVRAYNSIGGGPNTENLDVMTAKASAPLPPQDLVVAQEGTDFFMVSWLPPYPPYGPHDAYKIRYQLLESERWVEKQHGIKDPELQCPSESPRFCYNVTGLEPGNQYKVQVATRIEGASYGPWSSLVIANTLQILPDAPRAIHLIEKTDHSLHIKWVPPTDPKGHISQYRVSIVSLDDPTDEASLRDFLALSNEKSKQFQRKTHLVDHPTLTYLFENLKPETSYNVSISAGSKRGFGREIWTRYSTDPFVIPVVIAAPSVTPDGASALDVQWSGVVDSQNRVKGYIIEIRNSDTPVWQEIGGVTHHDAVKRSYLKKLTGLDADTLYFVRIKVVDHKQRVGGASPEAQGRTGCAPPTSPPANVNLASPSNVQVRVNWQAPVKVSPWSNELELTTAEGAPGTVTDLTATPTGPTSIEVTWRPPVDPNGVITGYTLVYNLKSMGECGPRSSTPIQKHVRSETQVLDGLLPDSTYEVHVIAHTSMAGPQSKVVTVTTEEAAPSGSPNNVRVGSVTSTRADVTWSQPDCELRNGKITGYEYELESVDPWGENSTALHSSERLTLNDLVPYNEYRIRVRAMNSVGEGPFSEWARFTTHPAAPPAPSDLVEEGAFPHAIEISFAAPSPPHGNIDYYRIRHTPSGQLNYKEVRVEAERLECSDASKKDRLCFRVHDLDPEQDYEIQVAVHTESGAWSEWSEPLNARTEQQNIPVLERELEVIDTKPDSITLRFEGVPQDQATHVVGYVLEFKSEDDDDWAEYNGVIKHRKSTNDYKVMVKQLETATNYFFRLRVVGKNDKRGAPGPETKAMTSCGKPEEPPSNVRIESDDFESVKITWTPPSENTWRCDDVEFVIDYVNTTTRGSLTVPVDSPSELVIATMPGTRWEVKMRTQTVEDGAKPQTSKWSDKVTLTTQSLPGELFVTVEPTGPREALVTWDLPDKDQKWNYGVDISYRLKQLGGCNEAATGSQEPITKLNIQEKQVPLEELAPGSVYEVIVTPRRPPSLHSSIVAPKTVRTFKTKNDVPTGPPMNLQSSVRKDTELGFKWDAPECVHQNGNVSQYEFELVGMDEWNEGTREGVTPRTNTIIDQLQPGSLYRMKVRAYTAEGPGPWSDPLEIRTTGSELGPPRELTAVQTKSTAIQLTWLPPYPEKAVVTAYRVRYSPRADDSNPTEVELSGDELSCTGYKSPIITNANLCTTIKNLQPATTYRFAVQGQSSSGTWGEWSNDYFSTTRKDDNELLGGSLKLLSAGHDNLKVKWTPPAVIGEKIDTYQLFISVASELDQSPKDFTTPGSQTDYHFSTTSPCKVSRAPTSSGSSHRCLPPLTSVRRCWHSGCDCPSLYTLLPAEGLLSWLPAPTDLHLIEKSDTMLHVDWVPPEIFDVEQRELLTHYRVTIAPFDARTGVTGPKKNYTVPVPGNSIKFDGLSPETVYNITVQAGTNSGYGQILWGTYSTLAPGQRHIIRLLNRTPTTLHVEWEPVWGRNHNGYILTARSLHSVYSNVRINQVKTFDVESWESDFVIRGLNPSTVYNVTLKPKDHSEVAWGAYATLPPGWFLVKNLKQCDKTNFAVSMSWEPVELNMASDYQVRYLRMKDNEAGWIEEDARESKELLCPKDGCGRLCYLVFNLPHNPSEYVFQVRAKVDGEWNHWRSAPRKVITGETAEIRRSCCIVPPPYMVENIGSPGSWWEVDVSPAATEKDVTRYYVVVDERDPPGESNWTELTDKVTANKMKIPYYVAASYDINTLTEPKKVRIGDGTVIGGYLNYPLVKGKKYNYEVYTVWNVTGVPVVGRSRGRGKGLITWRLRRSRWR
ncbi:unnamed protein product [Heligmosomoides polygyrus]|uniref:Fibronectin type-III domain-containing protein n=1 Tax=Heligmosomoides polygyrus TaxID=6339 RepID=A0A3P7XKU3_HELPZ|nr:unnamed protein product [Heligmosomoides polygyrus]